LHSLGLIEEGLVFVEEILILGLGVHPGRLSVTITCISQLELSLGTTELGVSGTQLFQRADVIGLGGAYVEDTDRLRLVNT
jgi:hypothetical protein